MLGGLLGAGGTLGSAWIAGRLQSSSQHGQWRREGRREAYSTFIAAVIALQEKIEAWTFAIFEQFGGDYVHKAHAEIEACVSAIRSAVPVVAVEGPVKVADLAVELGCHVQDVAIQAQRIMDEGPDNNWGLPTKVGDKVPDAPRLPKARSEVSRCLDEFIVSARNALDAK